MEQAQGCFIFNFLKSVLFVVYVLLLSFSQDAKVDKDARRKVMAKMLAHIKGGYLKLQAALGNARNCFNAREFTDDQLCQQAEQVGGLLLLWFFVVVVVCCCCCC
jgi:hypothetical protein